MATGLEHYREAERILEEFGRKFEVDDNALPMVLAHIHAAMARAQVHSTLALAAATALGHEGEGRTMPLRDRAQWFKTAGTPSPGPIEMEES